MSVQIPEFLGLSLTSSFSRPERPAFDVLPLCTPWIFLWIFPHFHNSYLSLSVRVHSTASFTLLSAQPVNCASLCLSELMLHCLVSLADPARAPVFAFYHFMSLIASFPSLQLVVLDELIHTCRGSSPEKPSSKRSYSALEPYATCLSGAWTLGNAIGPSAAWPEFSCLGTSDWGTFRNGSPPLTPGRCFGTFKILISCSYFLHLTFKPDRMMRLCCFFRQGDFRPGNSQTHFPSQPLGNLPLSQKEQLNRDSFHRHRRIKP